MPATRTLGPLLAAVLVAACSAVAGPGPTPVPTPEPTPTAVPGPGGVGGPAGGGVGGAAGNVGGGVAPRGGIVDPGAGFDPILGQAQFVTPTPNLINQHPVSVQRIRAAADAKGASAELRWWSGIAPCSALDSVRVEKDESAKTIKLTVIEGSGRGDVACIDIAQLKATVVDLGVLAAGTWTISAEGDAPAISLDIS
jgi:hypothetical protein